MVLHNEICIKCLVTRTANKKLSWGKTIQ